MPPRQVYAQVAMRKGVVNGRLGSSKVVNPHFLRLLISRLKVQVLPGALAVQRLTSIMQAATLLHETCVKLFASIRVKLSQRGWTLSAGIRQSRLRESRGEAFVTIQGF